MSQKKRFFHNNIIALSGILAAALMLIVFAIRGFYPFGSGSVAAGDAFIQYVPLLEQARTKLFAGDFLYSWADGLGYNFFATGAYYFFSPLTLLALLLPISSVFEVFNIALLFKVTASACTFSYYLIKSFEKKDLSVTVFSLCYAFCGFFAAYAFNIMWLDALVFLPLIALGIERIVEEKSGVLYCVSLALAIFSCFYTGFMLCIFSVLYFLVRIFGTEGLTSSYNKHLLKERIKNEQLKMDNCGRTSSSPDCNCRQQGDEIENDGWGEAPHPNGINEASGEEYEGRAVIPILFRFGFYSLLAGALFAVTLYPLYLSLGDAFIKSSAQDTLLFSFWDFLSAHLFGTNTINNYTAYSIPMPFLYSGIISLLLAPILLFVKKIRLSERITYSFLTLFLVVSLLFSDINIIWHGLSVPAGFPFRFAFLYTFLLVVIAYKVFINIKSVKNVLLIISTVLAACASIALLFFGNEFYGTKEMIINLLLILLISAVLFALKNLENKKKLLTTALLLIVAVELTANTALTVITNNSNVEKVVSQKSAIQSAASSVEKDALSRSEVLENDNSFDFALKGSFYDINAISTFHSLSDEVLTFSIGGLGNSYNRLNAFNYKKQTPVFDSFFSIKYLYDFSNDNFNSKYYTKLGEFSSKDKKATADLYEYNYTLPVMFCVSEDIPKWKGCFLSDFHSQNLLFENATGIADLFSIVKSQNHSGKNTQVKSIEEMIAEGTFDEDSLDTYAPHIANEYINGVYEATILDQKNPENAEVTLSYIIDTDSPLYFFYSSNVFDYLTVKVNGVAKEYSFSEYLVSYIIPIENTKKGDTLEFTATLSPHILEIFEKSEEVEKASAPIWLKLYSMDEEKFQKGYDYLNEGALDITEHNSTYIKGTIAAKENQKIFTSIPYSTGWSAFIDGKETEVICPEDTHLILLDIDKGEHTVELKYTVPGLKLGGTVSAAALLLFIFAVFVEIRIKRKK